MTVHRPKKSVTAIATAALILVLLLPGCDETSSTYLSSSSSSVSKSSESSSVLSEKESFEEEVGVVVGLEEPKNKRLGIGTIVNAKILYSVFTVEGELQSDFFIRNLETNEDTAIITLKDLYMYSGRFALFQNRYLYSVLPDAATYCFSDYNEVYEVESRIVCFDLEDDTGEVVKTYSSGDILTYPVVLDERRLAMNTSVCDGNSYQSAVSIYTPEDDSLVPAVTKQLYRSDEGTPWSDFRSSAPPEGMKGEAIHCFAVHEGELYLLVSERSGNEGQKPVYRLEIYSPEGEPAGVIPFDAFGYNSYLNTTILPQAQLMQVSDRHIFFQTFSSQTALLERTGRESLSTEIAWRGVQGGMWEGESLSNPQVLLRSADGNWLLDSQTGKVEKIGFLSPNASREYGRRDGNRALVHTSFEADGDSWTEELYYDDLEDAIRQAREREAKTKTTAKATAK